MTSTGALGDYSTRNLEITGTTSELTKDLTQDRYNQLVEEAEARAEVRLPKCEKCGKPFKPPYNFPSAKFCFDCKPAKPFIKHEARRSGWSHDIATNKAQDTLDTRPLNAVKV